MIIFDCLFSHSGCSVLKVLILCHLLLVTSGCVCVCTHLACMLACEMLVILKTLEALSIDGYVSSLSPPKTSDKLYFDFKLNCGIQSVKCVCLILISIPFFKVSINTDMGAHMTNLTRPLKDVFVSYHTKVVKYKPEFPYSKLKKPATVSEYVINEADIYDEVDALGKLLNFS